MKINFTADELLSKGFIEEEDGGSKYFTYLLDPQDYLGSKFLATTDDGDYNDYYVHSPYNDAGQIMIGEDQPVLTEDQITDIITRGQF